MKYLLCLLLAIINGVTFIGCQKQEVPVQTVILSENSTEEDAPLELKTTEENELPIR
jgi:hypothetical protein